MWHYTHKKLLGSKVLMLSLDKKAQIKLDGIKPEQAGEIEYKV